MRVRANTHLSNAAESTPPTRQTNQAGKNEPKTLMMGSQPGTKMAIPVSETGSAWRAAPRLVGMSRCSLGTPKVKSREFRSPSKIRREYSHALRCWFVGSSLGVLRRVMRTGTRSKADQLPGVVKND